ncbi:MAG TPA: HNH endonuclease signature motif containing protein [Solirubrobacterales bacterium]|nr:HNH endonuclease signature motif containing protein [Solirubrobacterales bacterium]
MAVSSIPSPSHPLLHWDPAAADPEQRRIHPLLRGAVLHRDEWSCRYCGGEAMWVDHVDPRARGGLTTPANLVASCQLCNRTKGSRTPGEWERAKALARLLAKSSPCRSRRDRAETATRASRRRRLPN